MKVKERAVEIWMDPDDPQAKIFVVVGDLTTPEQYEWVIRQVSHSHEIQRGVGLVEDKRPAFVLQPMTAPKEIGDIMLEEVKALCRNVNAFLGSKAEAKILHFCSEFREQRAAAGRLFARTEALKRERLLV